MMSKLKYKAIAVGASAGGIEAFKGLLDKLGKNIGVPVLIVQHVKKGNQTDMASLFSKLTGLDVREAAPNEPILPGVIYMAPPDYHMAVEQEKTITLLSSEPVNYSRPSIDVLFETAAEAYRHELIGIVLSGSSRDGSDGLLRIHEFGGCTIVQSPEEAEYDTMPIAAINRVNTSFVGTVDEIAKYLTEQLS